MRNVRLSTVREKRQPVALDNKVVVLYIVHLFSIMSLTTYEGKKMYALIRNAMQKEEILKELRQSNEGNLKNCSA